MDDVDAELAHKENNKQNSSCKMCFKSLNKQSKVEVLIQCGTCNGHGKFFKIKSFNAK